jgi:hypothetical protein
MLFTQCYVLQLQAGQARYAVVKICSVRVQIGHTVNAILSIKKAKSKKKYDTMIAPHSNPSSYHYWQ